MKKLNLFLVCSLLLTAMFWTTSCENNNNLPDPPNLPSYIIDLNRDSLSFLYTGGNQTITVSSNGSWTVSDMTNWLTVRPSSGAGNETITITASANESSETREATLTFTAGTNTATLVVTQSYLPYLGVVINGVRWATRNLASQGTFVENPENFGGLFQWGRAGDGHEQRNSRTTLTRSPNDMPGHGDFITTSASPFDWRSHQNNGLWRNPKTPNDPCPQGWRVPTEGEFLRLTNTSNVSSQWINLNGIAGRIFTDRTTDNTLFLPAAGWRGHGSGALYHVGTRGYYWSSNASGMDARHLTFVSSSVSVNYFSRANGFSVRCVAE
jgi:uncharacterized protein (TIGR02145 family)